MTGQIKKRKIYYDYNLRITLFVDLDV